MKKPVGFIRAREERFADRQRTKITYERPSEENSYIPQEIRWCGYDVIELMRRRSYVDVVYLLLRGQLPSRAESEFLEALFIAFANPGPRAEATRAAMAAASGKTRVEHLVPIGAAVSGGAFGGAGEVSESMRFLRRAVRKPAAEFVDSKTRDTSAGQRERLAPGFGTVFGGRDLVAESRLNLLLEFEVAGRYLKWTKGLHVSLKDQGDGVLMSGLFAAALLDMGFQPRHAPGIFQFVCIPGILAHALEYASEPITELPMVSDEKYFYEED